MRNIIFTLFAIGLAAFAAMAATTFVLNTPMRIGPPAGTTAQTTSPQAPAPAPSDKPAPSEPGTPAPAPAPEGGTPDKSAPATPGTAAPAGEEEADKDPYEGIAPEELPPDLQYSADSSVSFPTNI